MSRDYQQALQKLTQLQSNRTITHLFDKSPQQAKASAQDLNAAALPEMLQWLRRAGYAPQDLSRMRHIHVAGTKGKGSVCAFATSMLHQYDTVGTYTSPHLVSPRERIAINGQPVTQEVFSKAFFELWDCFTESAKKEGMAATDAEGPASKPFFFRFLTILAWHIFLQQQVRNVVMECGIGGEYDATNVLPAEAVSAAVISQLGIDHVAMLGETVEEIAWHKAGILKADVKGFTVNVRNQPSVMEVLRSRAEEKGAALVEVNPDEVEAWGGVSGHLKGEFQKLNQALAVMAVREHLGLSGGSLQDIPGEMVRGLREAALRGRCEIIHQGELTWLLDGAHTTESLEQVAKWVAQEVQPEEEVILVFNQQERDAPLLLKGFVEAVELEMGRQVFRHALFTRNELQPQAVQDLSVQEAAAATMRMISLGCKTTILDNVEDAVEEARRLLGEGKGKILVTGSLHLVGGILQILEPDTVL
ncbi:hypothetical protein QQS21_007495 [Conoideocrella luteorostrata]|uniref:Folylpolyglutamate synthase n=1 Tax=Conoideocrella luteorostrata TaxID=1105319 RepID=A0AAJ0FSD4_9HYPO|nr:hypothetical protein QQS21_007495 [Conoideocrella luteorostrata]